MEEEDSEMFAFNYFEDVRRCFKDVEDVERVAIVALASDGNGSCFPIYDQVPSSPDLHQRKVTRTVNEHDSSLPVPSFPSSLLISFNPQPASCSFRDASAQVSSLKVTDPLPADSMKRADEDERALDRDEKEDGAGGDAVKEEDEEEYEDDEDDESSIEGTFNFDCDRHGINNVPHEEVPSEMVCMVCGVIRLKDRLKGMKSVADGSFLDLTIIMF